MAFFASTPVDRMSLYLIPLQLYVLSRLPFLFLDVVVRGSTIIAIVLLYGLVLWVWLNYADHAYYWVPYDNYLLP